MEKRSWVDLHMEASGGLKELVLRWFTETQAQFILNNGDFPDWFQGFSTRKETEHLLRDKAPGCFLIRLSDKAIGYILSYKGHDRCRHFVIMQNEDGQFNISGDCRTYGSITELIENYRGSPIQPFGEHLTSSCYEVFVGFYHFHLLPLDDGALRSNILKSMTLSRAFAPVNTGQLYDVINYNIKRKSGLSVRALTTLWDQGNHYHPEPGCHHTMQQHNEPPTAQPPPLPPKSKSRLLTGAGSVDTTSPSQSAPPEAGRDLLSSLSQTESLPLRESQTDSERLRRNTNSSTFDPDARDSCDPCPPAVTYSEVPVVQSRSKEEGLKHSLQSPRDSSEQHVETFRSNSVHQASTLQRRPTYAEVHHRPTASGLADSTYEQVAWEVVHGNTYESLEDMRNRKSKSTCRNNVGQAERAEGF